MQDQHAQQHGDHRVHERIGRDLGYGNVLQQVSKRHQPKQRSKHRQIHNRTHAVPRPHRAMHRAAEHRHAGVEDARRADLPSRRDKRIRAKVEPPRQHRPNSERQRRAEQNECPQQRSRIASHRVLRMQRRPHQHGDAHRSKQRPCPTALVQRIAAGKKRLQQRNQDRDHRDHQRGKPCRHHLLAPGQQHVVAAHE